MTAILTLKDVLDILLVATLIYQGYQLLSGTRAMNLLRGLVVFGVAWFLSRLLQLTTLNFLLGEAATVGLFALIVVFQPELRQVLERVGRARVRETRQTGATLQELTRALERMAERKIGALVAFERRTPLGEYAATGVRLDALVSAPFVEALFARNAPLHDGGVIVSGDRIVAAACLFPLQNLQDGVYKRYGTRHRAALGISEATDAVVMVVSEERGSIRIAHGGRLSPDLTGSELRERLRELIYEEQP
ncbi:diadenylate cyclase [Deinobacterium chartae]|uniref:Diadenylate cyclase n=1 Tax=Deinobacterium chartae TaxID=521158 RepID=A0A841I2F0_9DEIO|nr:diadenylate cyclase [Deinobacterium chartae]